VIKRKEKTKKATPGLWEWASLEWMKKALGEQSSLSLLILWRRNLQSVAMMMIRENLEHIFHQHLQLEAIGRGIAVLIGCVQSFQFDVVYPDLIQGIDSIGRDHLFKTDAMTENDIMIEIEIMDEIGSEIGTERAAEGFNKIGVPCMIHEMGIKEARHPGDLGGKARRDDPRMTIICNYLRI